MVALAIKNPSAKATKSCVVKRLKETKLKTIALMEHKKSVAPMGALFSSRLFKRASIPVASAVNPLMSLETPPTKSKTVLKHSNIAKMPITKALAVPNRG